MTMSLFPSPADDIFHGPRIAYVAFVIMTVITLFRSVAHIVLPDGGALSIATIPLDTLGERSAGVIIGLFAQWGLSQLLMGFFFGIVLWRYKSLIPLMWLFLTIEWSSRFLLHWVKPIETRETAPGEVGNVIFPVVAFTMLILCMGQHPTEQASDPKRN